MNLALINPKVWLELALAALIAGACWWGYTTIYNRGAESVQVKWDAEKHDQAEQSAKIAANALQITKDLQTSADKTRETTNAQIATLNRSLAAAVAGLSNRPARPDASGVPGDTAAGSSPGCTGAQLYRPDGEFLARESARAERLRLELQQCQAQYGDARKAVSP